MNNYIVFLNGRLLTPDVKVAFGVSAEHGNYTRVYLSDEDAETMSSVDVLEYRAGSCVRRYRYDRQPDVGSGYDKNAGVRCQSVINSF